MTSAGEGSNRDKVVLFPATGMGHLVSMVELAKLFVLRGLDVTIVVVEPPYHSGSAAAFIATAAAANPSITFHRLPPVALPPSPSPHREAQIFNFLHLNNPNLLDFLRSAAAPPLALVVDMFCFSAVDVAAELGVPCYMFCPSGAAFLATLLNVPTLHAASDKSFRELGSAPLQVPGNPPLPANHFPVAMHDRGDKAYEAFLSLGSRTPDHDGIIVNTFPELERRALDAIAAGLCVTDGRATPPICAIGPLIKWGSRGRDDEVFAWLDAQPRHSVVFLCFGSMGRFSEAQLKEMAAGLELSGQRFLWVVRTPSSGGPSKNMEQLPEPDLDALLPEGFLERTEGRGLVVKSWAPQVEVLGHDSVGGFVTHCGWNSVLEAVAAGVPMVAWPLYAEQWMNKVFLTEEMRVAVAVEGYDEELVRSEEIENKVRWLMESEGGRELRERTAAMKEKAAEALGDGGSSQAVLTKLVAEWKCRSNRN